MDTDSIPAPPIIESPNAPASGRYSATKPSIVDQKKVTPTANKVAATNVIPPEVIISIHKPASVKIAEYKSIPEGFSLCTTYPTDNLPKAIIPLIKANTKRGDSTEVFLN